MRTQLATMKQQRLLGLLLCSLSLVLLGPEFSGVALATVSLPVLLQFIGGVGAILAGFILLYHTVVGNRN